MLFSKYFGLKLIMRFRQYLGQLLTTPYYTTINKHANTIATSFCNESESLLSTTRARRTSLLHGL